MGKSKEGPLAVPPPGRNKIEDDEIDSDKVSHFYFGIHEHSR